MVNTIVLRRHYPEREKGRVMACEYVTQSEYSGFILLVWTDSGNLEEWWATDCRIWEATNG